MTDQPIQPRFTDDTTAQHPARLSRQDVSVDIEARGSERKLSFIASLDKPMMAVVILLLTIGSGMVFSTTFDWSLQARGSNTAIFLEDHMRNVGIGLMAMAFFALVDYRFWKRFAVWLLLVTIGALVAVLLFGDDVFGARRSLIAGRFQPGELAEFTMIVYLAAWLGARNTKVGHFAFGMIPFAVLIGLVAGLVGLQPDLSSSVIIGVTGLIMYFVAGARISHIVIAFVIAIVAGLLLIQTQPYAQQRFVSYSASWNDPTQANYHTQQAIIAFLNGGWFGRGLGQGEQKFGFLPAPHTDSIFAVIGEELGVVGASLVVLLYIAFVIRGFHIARRAADTFGSLLAIGFTAWVATQALLNIAVMTAVIPSSGLPLPFISYGGSSLLVLMIGVGMMLSVNRVASRRQKATRRRKDGANYDWGWGDGRARLSRAGRRGSAPQARPRRS